MPNPGPALPVDPNLPANIPILPVDGDSDLDSEASTLPYDTENRDLVSDEHPTTWATLEDTHKMCPNTASFTIPQLFDEVIDIRNVMQPPHSLVEVSSSFTTTAAFAAKSKVNRARKEATTTDLRNYAKQFREAKKAEYESWLKNDVFDLIDVRKQPSRNLVTGRWVLTVKRNMDGSFQKCKARWVLRGFQDKQKWDQQTDSPTCTRPGFRLTCQKAADKYWSVSHMDLKTAFLQGEEYDNCRDVVCQLPPEAGHPPHIAARLKKPAYGMNDAPRRWWNKVDSSLRSYGMIPTRADRCCYVLYDKPQAKTRTIGRPPSRSHSGTSTLDEALDYLMGPISGSPAYEGTVQGIICLHVDDLFITGGAEMKKRVLDRIRTDFQVGSEDTDEIVFTGQRIRWNGKTLVVDQDKAIEELSVIQFDKSLKDEVACNPTLHTEYRSLLGSINWLQSRTQFQITYKFSRCASAAASPTIGDIRALNKVVRSVRSQHVKLHFWPLDRLRGQAARIVGYPDASYRNNSDGSSQRAQVIFLAEPRTTSKHSRGSLVDCESTKIKRTTLSTTVSELYSFMKCFGTCQFVRGLWMDISGESASIHEDRCQQLGYHSINDPLA
jgi:hypothetical protein